MAAVAHAGETLKPAVEEEGYVDGKESVVIGDRLDVYDYVDDLTPLEFYRNGIVDDILAVVGKTNREIFQTILVVAGIVNPVDAAIDNFPERAGRRIASVTLVHNMMSSVSGCGYKR